MIILVRITIISLLIAHLTIAFANPEIRPSTNQFIIITDIHFNPFISCAGKIPCPLIEKLRKAPPQEWAQLFRTYDQSPIQYNQDTNFKLLTSTLAVAKQICAQRNIQFVLMLGDFLGHDFRRFYKFYTQDKSKQGYRTFVAKTFTFLNQTFANTFPTIDVFAAVGNNDAYVGNYRWDATSAFFKDMGVQWDELIKSKHQSMQRSFARGGYYALTLPQDNHVRLIVLNTTLFSTVTKGNQVDIYADHQLNWLEKELAAAKQNQQKVFIAMHIPDGIDLYATAHLRLFRLVSLWKPTYSTRFQAALKTYASNISAIFAGHLHTDWFQVLSFDQFEIPMTGTLSVSPLFGNNPGFKVYTYSTADSKLENFITTYYAIHHKHLWGLATQIVKDRQQCRECLLLKSINFVKSLGHFSFYKMFAFWDKPSADSWSQYQCQIYDKNILTENCRNLSNLNIP